MLQKQSVNINFAQGLDTKTDPWQVAAGKFLSLENSVFTKGGQLQKRNGYASLAALPYASSYLTTFNNDLTAVGEQIQALVPGIGSWVYKGAMSQIQIEAAPLVKNSLNQIQCDSAIAANNLVCTVYTEKNSSTLSYKYVISDLSTGQNVVAPTLLSDADATYGTPRVFLLGKYFVILYTALVSGVYKLKYLAVNSITFETSTDIVASTYTPATTVAFDGVVYNNELYIAYNGAAATGIKVVSLNAQLALSSTINPDSAHSATMFAMAVSEDQNVVWVAYYNSATNNGYAVGLSPQLDVLRAATQVISSTAVLNLTCYGVPGGQTSAKIIFEVNNNYTYDATIPTHYLKAVTINQTGTVKPSTVFVRSVGLAGKAFVVSGKAYIPAVYQSPYQPTFFILNDNGSAVAKLAYQNAGGYLINGLPSVSVIDSVARFPYLYKDTIAPVNKNINVPAGSQVAGVYAQLGINLASAIFGAQPQSVEIGSNLNLTGGITWAYDGYQITEQNFFLYPESIKATASTSGGNMDVSETFYYAVTYEWSDNQGNIFRSAPSVPLVVPPKGGSSTGSVTLEIPTLRLTYKTDVKICVYRWCTSQQTFYQTIANYLTAPTLNNPAVDYVTVVDTLADSSIVGNPILYTTGGVVENIGPPAFSNLFLYDDRVWGISAEDPNLLWYSKQVIEATPVEMSDLFTMYVAPSLGAQGPSGDLQCGFPMDDKAILFKKASISYFNGSGPDNTGANSQYSQPILITSTLGCSNAQSIVFMPNGLMFEFSSEAGNQIWLLGRDLSTVYIGAAVEELTKNATIQSAVNIPGTNQVRFTLSTGITLMYDYYYQQWGTFTGVPAVSSTLYQGLHTYLNASGLVFQESPEQYLDGTVPVTMSFTTSWLNIAGLQGYQRSYFFYLLGKYYSPHKLLVEVAYDYNDAPVQGSLILPLNYSPAYGESNPYGQELLYGGNSAVENWRVFLSRQRCSSIQISMTEYFDPSLGQPAGAGLTLSGLNLVVAAKKSFRPQSASTSVG